MEKKQWLLFTFHGHSEIGSAPCATPFFRSHDSPGSAGHQLIQYWKFCSLLRAVRNSEQLKGEPHFQLFLSHVIFCTPLQEFKKDRPLLYIMSHGLKICLFYHSLPKNANISAFFCSELKIFWSGPERKHSSHEKLIIFIAITMYLVGFLLAFPPWHSLWTF